MFSYRVFIIGSVFAIFVSCRPEKAKIEFTDIKQYNWGTPTSVMIERGYFHSKKSLDTIANQLTGDTLIPVQINESKIIIEKLEPLHMELRIVDGIEDFYITETGFKSDTFMFDVKEYIGKFFLVLISPNSASHVFELKDENVVLSETDNLSSPRFEIKGYAIGDKIDRTDIQVLHRDQFGTTLTEEAVLINNENVLLKIVAERYIEQMKWTNIDEANVQIIIKDLNTIFTTPPDIEFFPEEQQTDPEEILQYYWSENEVNVLLTKATELGNQEDVWSLTCTNLIFSNILNNYLESTSDNL